MSVVHERAYLGHRPKGVSQEGHHRDLPALRAGPDVGKGCHHSMAVPVSRAQNPSSSSTGSQAMLWTPQTSSPYR